MARAVQGRSSKNCALAGTASAEPTTIVASTRARSRQMCLLLGFVTKLSAAVNFSSDELSPLTQAPKSVDLRMVQCLVSHGSRSSSGSMAMLAAMLGGRSPPRLLLEIDVGAKKDAGFRKTRVASSRGVDVAFGGRPWRATRASASVRPQPLTNPYSLGDHPSKRRRGMGRPRRLGWCRVGVSTMTHGPAPYTGMVDEALKRPPESPPIRYLMVAVARPRDHYSHRTHFRERQTCLRRRTRAPGSGPGRADGGQLGLACITDDLR